MAKHHPKEEISQAIEYALDRGWRFEKSRGHVFGVLYCPAENRTGCKRSVFSTPKSAEAHAKDIRRIVDRCPHTE